MIFKQRWIALKRDQRGGHRKYREKGFTPMKIAVWHNLPSGGGKRALYYHVRGLVERGHTVESWCPPTADVSYLPLRELIPEHAVPNEWTLYQGRYKLTRLITPYKNMTEKI